MDVALVGIGRTKLPPNPEQSQATSHRAPAIEDEGVTAEATCARTDPIRRNLRSRPPQPRLNARCSAPCAAALRGYRLSSTPTAA